VHQNDKTIKFDRKVKLTLEQILNTLASKILAKKFMIASLASGYSLETFYTFATLTDNEQHCLRCRPWLLSGGPYLHTAIKH
jgi:hypothetical protein